MNTQHAIRLLQETCALNHTALSTEKSYIHWLQHYARFLHGPKRQPLPTAESKIEAFLTDLEGGRSRITIRWRQMMPPAGPRCIPAELRLVHLIRITEN